MTALGKQDSAPRPLGRLLAPTSVAVVGASERHPAVVETVSSGPATVWLVNPRRERVLDQRCYPAIADLPEVPDVVMVVVGHQLAEQAASEALRFGTRALVVPGVGAEAGPSGRAISRALAALADAADVPLLGTNCMGYANPAGQSLWIGTLPRSVRAGHVSVVAQSGSIAEGLLACGPRIGFRFVVSSGGEVNRDAADFLFALALDDGTKAVGLFLETVRRPDAFRRALEACAVAGKPVVCLKVGRSETAAAVALTHTGAMVGSHRAFSALLAAYGVIEVADVHELVETLEVLGRGRRPRGCRTAAVSESGGEAALLADCADGTALRLDPVPEQTAQRLRDQFPNLLDVCNPLDVWAIDEVQRVFPLSFQALCDSGAYDILIAEVELTRHRSERDNAWCEEVVRALAAATDGTDLFPAVVAATPAEPPAKIIELAAEADVALLRGTGAAVQALAAVAAWRPRRPAAPPPSTPVEVDDLLRDGFLPEFESATLLRRYGVRFAPFRRVSNAAEAREAAAEIGFPVVIKIDDAAHKSAAGGVVLGISSAQEAAATATRLGGNVLVARQLPASLEVILGFARDPMYGPVLTAGLGGTLAEELDASVVALAPVDHTQAQQLLATLPGVTPGGLAHRDLACALVALSKLALEHPEIAAVDINPLLVTDQGAIAVDALVATSNVPRTATSHCGDRDRQHRQRLAPQPKLANPPTRRTDP
jgi:acyl-CoA synthetase (NDP forming)